MLSCNNCMDYFLFFHDLISDVYWLVIYIYNSFLFSFIIWYIVSTYCVIGYVVFIQAYVVTSAFSACRIPTMYRVVLSSMMQVDIEGSGGDGGADGGGV
jgi:surface antigen